MKTDTPDHDTFTAYTHADTVGRIDEIIDRINDTIEACSCGGCERDVYAAANDLVKANGFDPRLAVVTAYTGKMTMGNC